MNDRRLIPADDLRSALTGSGARPVMRDGKPCWVLKDEALPITEHEALDTAEYCLLQNRHITRRLTGEAFLDLVRRVTLLEREAGASQ